MLLHLEENGKWPHSKQKNKQKKHYKTGASVCVRIMSMNSGPASLILSIYFMMFTFLYLVQINLILWPQNAEMDVASAYYVVLFSWRKRKKSPIWFGFTNWFFCFPSFFVYNYAAFSYLSSVYFTEGIKTFSFFYFVFIVFHISAKQSPSVIHYKKKKRKL